MRLLSKHFPLLVCSQATGAQNRDILCPEIETVRSPLETCRLPDVSRNRLHTHGRHPQSPAAAKAPSENRISSEPVAPTNTQRTNAVEERVARGHLLLQETMAGLQAAGPGASILVKESYNIALAITGLAFSIETIGIFVDHTNSMGGEIKPIALAIYTRCFRLLKPTFGLFHIGSAFPHVGSSPSRLVEGLKGALPGLRDAIHGLPSAMKGLGLITTGHLENLVLRLQPVLDDACGIIERVPRITSEDLASSSFQAISTAAILRLKDSMRQMAEILSTFISEVHTALALKLSWLSADGFSLRRSTSDLPQHCSAEERIAHGNLLLQDIITGLRAAGPGASVLWQESYSIAIACMSLSVSILAFCSIADTLASFEMDGIMSAARLVSAVGSELFAPYFGLFAMAASFIANIPNPSRLIDGLRDVMPGLLAAARGLPSAMEGLNLIASGRLENHLLHIQHALDRICKTIGQAQRVTSETQSMDSKAAIAASKTD